MKKLLAAATVATLALGNTITQAALTADPDAVTTGIESAFDAAALIGIAILGVTLGIRFVKKGLRVA